MTQLQKLACVNLILLPGIVAGIVVSGFNETVGLICLYTFCGVALVLIVLMAKMPWQKGAADDERDRVIRSRSMSAAYYCLLPCLVAGLVTASVAFPDGAVSIKWLSGMIGVSYFASVMAMSVSVLVQNARGVRHAAD